MAYETTQPKKVLLTGATGFVGGYVLKELVAHGYVPVCLVRNADQFSRRIEILAASEVVTIPGDLFTSSALQKAAEQSDLAIHLVGIIMEHGTDTFSRVHYEGTRQVVDVCRQAGIQRLVHMSALGTRSNAVSQYHQTKYLAEEYVKKSGLDWTIFRPSIIHGPDGEFMQLMKQFACGIVPPFMPYFGDGSKRLQPVDVRDVAECFVKALNSQHTIHKSYDLGGPRSYNWKELYQLCKRLIPGAKQWKPIIGQPVSIAMLMAMTVMKIPVPGSLNKLRFDIGQVQMSQEDSVCDIAPVENAFDLTLRDFETELKLYADQIRGW